MPCFLIQKKRKEYDSRSFEAVSDFSQEDLFGGINFDEIFRGSGFSFDTGGFGGGFFDSIYQQGGQRESCGEDMRVELRVSLQKIMSGIEAEIRLSHPRVCPLCHFGCGDRGSYP